MKKIILTLILLTLPSTLFAGTEFTNRPYWSLELYGGWFMPDIENWSAAYGNRYTSDYGGALGFKVLRQLEVGVEGSVMRDSGSGWAPLHNSYSGHVTYELYPLNVFVLARGLFNEDQWVVPYAGGGWTRMFYREEVEYQGVARGSVDGFHARGGLQFLMDVLDPHAANNLYRDFGIYHTYAFVEAEYTRAMVDTVDSASAPSRSVNLGGTSLRAGLLFEF